MNNDRQSPRQITADEARRLGTSAWMIRGEDFIRHYTYATVIPAR